jgi:hypothetical protein
MTIQYRPLDRTTQEIRVLEMKPATNLDSPLSCLIKHVPLQTANFFALSYVWGDQKANRQSLAIEYEIKSPSIEQTQYHHVKTTVGENLGAALARLRLPDDSVTIWADAVCINQSDNDEKSWQVQLMGEIYKTASKTFVWLGPLEPTECSDTWELILDASEQIEQLLETSPDANGDTVYETSVWMTHLDEEVEVQSLSHVQKMTVAFCQATAEFLVETEEVVALYKFVERISQSKWWTRVWVLQEAALAESLTFVYGERSVASTTLFFGLYLCNAVREVFLKESAADIGKELNLDELPAMNLQIYSGLFLRHETGAFFRNPLPMLLRSLYIESTGCNNEATDPRDKIFAVLALVDPLGIVPDYRKSVEEVYIEAAKAMVLKGGAELLCLPQQKDPKYKLPTWVVDWSVQEERVADWLDYQSSGGVEPDVSFPGERGTLPTPIMSIKGVRVGTIDSTGKTYQECMTLNRSKAEMDAAVLFLSKVPSVQASLSQSVQFTRALLWLWLRQWATDLYENIKQTNHEDKITRIIEILFRVGPAESARGPFKAIKAQLQVELLKRATSLDSLLDPSFWFEESPEPNRSASICAQLARNSRIIVSGRGYIGYGPIMSQKNDEIVILYGVPSPLVIRKDNHNTFRIVGPAYVQGIMKGELMQSSLEEEIFNLI